MFMNGPKNLETKSITLLNKIYKRVTPIQKYTKILFKVHEQKQ